MAEVWVIAEHHNKTLKKVTLQGLGLGKKIATQLGGSCVGLVLGKDVEEIAKEVASYADRAIYLEHDCLENYRAESYTKAIADLALLHKPFCIIMGHTAFLGRDLAPRLLARLKASSVADCTDLQVEEGKLIATKPVYAGKAFVKFQLASEQKVITIRPNAFSAGKKHEEEKIEKMTPELSEASIRTKVLGFEKTGGNRPELTEAEIIVSGGRGMKGPENFHLLEEVADILGAAVGASRAVVDAGWRPHSDQVGQTGKTVSPNLYFAFGISGAIQHLAGMSSSKCIVAINKDPEAPIFKVARYGIAADLFEVVPPLKEELKQLKEKS